MKTFTLQTRCMTHGDKEQVRGFSEERITRFIQDCRERGDKVLEGLCYVVAEPDGCTVVVVALPESELLDLSA